MSGGVDLQPGKGDGKAYERELAGKSLMNIGVERRLVDEKQVHTFQMKKIIKN